jgi:hypothetical protein
MRASKGCSRLAPLKLDGKQRDGVDEEERNCKASGKVDKNMSVKLWANQL